MKMNDDLFEQVKRLVAEAQNEQPSQEIPDFDSPQGEELKEYLAASVQLYMTMARYRIKHGHDAAKYAQFFVKTMTPQLGNHFLDEEGYD